MINKNDILAALQSGTDPEVIAQNFADALNTAIAEKTKQEEEARQAKAAAQEKVDYMAEILAMLNHFIKEFYPEVYDEALAEKVSAADIVAAFDQAYDEVKRMQPFLDDFQNLIHKLEADPVVKDLKNKEKSILKPAIAGSPVDPIAAFLKMHDLQREGKILGLKPKVFFLYDYDSGNEKNDEQCWGKPGAGHLHQTSQNYAKLLKISLNFA